MVGRGTHAECVWSWRQCVLLLFLLFVLCGGPRRQRRLFDLVRWLSGAAARRRAGRRSRTRSRIESDFTPPHLPLDHAAASPPATPCSRPAGTAWAHYLGPAAVSSRMVLILTAAGVPPLSRGCASTAGSQSAACSAARRSSRAGPSGRAPERVDWSGAVGTDRLELPRRSNDLPCLGGWRPPRHAVADSVRLSHARLVERPAAPIVHSLRTVRRTGGAAAPRDRLLASTGGVLGQLRYRGHGAPSNPFLRGPPGRAFQAIG